VITPSIEYRRTSLKVPGKLHQGLDAVAHEWFGKLTRHPHRATTLRQEAVAIHKRAATLKSLHEPQLTALLAEMRSLFRRGDEVGQQPLHEALACVCEAARRQVHLQPYEVQIMAALAAHRGHLLEMATGEGKTLAIALPAVLAGWTGRPCHIITANDYLATRDAEWLSPFYQMCGLTAGCVTGAMKQAERKANYARDIIYTTSKEGAADLLRDRLQLGSLSNPTRRLIRTMLQPGCGQPRLAGHARATYRDRG
jgi:preprotein translocase subunit SecA